MRRHVSFEIAYRDEPCRALNALVFLLAFVSQQMLSKIAVSVEAFSTLRAEEFLKRKQS